MSDNETRFWIALGSALIACFFVPAALLWHFVVKEWIIDQITIWRLYIARRCRRAAYIRWWREL